MYTGNSWFVRIRLSCQGWGKNLRTGQHTSNLWFYQQQLLENIIAFASHSPPFSQFSRRYISRQTSMTSKVHKWRHNFTLHLRIARTSHDHDVITSQIYTTRPGTWCCCVKMKKHHEIAVLSLVCIVWSASYAWQKCRHGTQSRSIVLKSTVGPGTEPIYGSQ